MWRESPPIPDGNCGLSDSHSAGAQTVSRFSFDFSSAPQVTVVRAPPAPLERTSGGTGILIRVTEN